MLSVLAVFVLVIIGFAVRGVLGSADADDGNAEVGASGVSQEAESTSGVPDMGESQDGGSTTSNDAVPTDPESDDPESDDPDSDDQVSDDAVDASAEGDSTSDERKVLQQCQEELAAGDYWAAATAESAANWKQHYTASVRYNAGDFAGSS